MAKILRPVIRLGASLKFLPVRRLHVSILFARNNDPTPDIRGLDLAKNLIASWEIVASIAAELPKLEALDLRFDVQFSCKRIHLIKIIA